MDRLISERAVLGVINEAIRTGRFYYGKNQTIKEIKDIPSSQPKTEHWIEERTYMICPNCHDIWHYEKNQTERFKFCPTCGKRGKR